MFKNISKVKFFLLGRKHLYKGFKKRDFEYLVQLFQIVASLLACAQLCCVLVLTGIVQGLASRGAA